MLIRKTHTVRSFILGLSLAFAGGCGDLLDKAEEEDVDPDAQYVGGASGGVSSNKEITLTGSLNLAAPALLEATDITKLKMFCVTFEKIPRSGSSAFDASGAFSVTMYSNINFGCFINSATNETVGSFVVDGGGKGLSGGESSSMALNQDLDFGDLTLGTDGKVVVPAATIAKAASGVSNKLNVDKIHDQEYHMSCQTEGVDPERVAACTKFLTEDNEGEDLSVYFRVLKGTNADESKKVLGMGIWKDKASFTACGSVDITAAEQTSIEAEEGITFSQVSAGDFTVSAECLERNDDYDNQGPDEQNPPALTTEEGRPNLENYYALNKLTPAGAGYSFLDENSQTAQGPDGTTCSGAHSLSIEFSGTPDELYGAFTQSETRSACGDQPAESEFSSFSVTFTKVVAP